MEGEIAGLQYGIGWQYMKAHQFLIYKKRITFLVQLEEKGPVPDIFLDHQLMLSHY